MEFNIGDIVSFYFIGRKKIGKIKSLLLNNKFMIEELNTKFLYRKSIEELIKFYEKEK